MKFPYNLQDDTHKAETPTPTHHVTQAVPQSQVLPQYHAYPAYVGYSHCLPMTYRALQAGSCQNPVTPQAQRIMTAPACPPNKSVLSPLPLSSPPPASSPMSSPARRVVNLVSSPGPMGPGPQENDYDDLPYKLPLGPYLTTKPDLSYAALIGRAILSSPEHRLTLQEIYDWITIVYPYYKRGETTWMNSIRHVLSTTVVFRKVPRDRSIGRTLWAIYDEDLECFKDGGFKKHLCKDYPNDHKEKGKGKARRRGDDDDGDRKTKRVKKESTNTGSLTESAIVHSSFLAHNSLGSHLLFPGNGPTPHLQPYYQNCMPQPPTFATVPAGVIFPPLPASAAFSRINTGVSSVSALKTKDVSSLASRASSPPTSLSHSSPTPDVISSSTSTSIPELTPNRNSSSPPSSLPATSDIDVDMHVSRSIRTINGVTRTFSSSTIANAEDEEVHYSSSVGVDVDTTFNNDFPGLVKFWKNSPKQSATLQLGPRLPSSDDSDDENSDRKRKGKKKGIVRPTKVKCSCVKDLSYPKNPVQGSFPPMLISPTINLRTIQSKLDDSGRPTTPISSTSPPSTPPRSTHKLSSIRTPISHKGLHMSPSTSLAHYKSNLDPPPAVSGGVAPLEVSQNITASEDEAADMMKTPRKRTSIANAQSIFGLPVTPKKLVFSGMADSPFRTPGNSSPFRTPRSRAMFDPHDPGVILNDELNRMAYDSPAGLFGNERSSLLYDSPGLEGYRWW